MPASFRRSHRDLWRWRAVSKRTSIAPGRHSKGAEKTRIHVFLATSAIHRQYKLKMAKEEIVRQTVEMVKRAVDYCPNVEFSPEDASRTELDFLCEVVERAIEAGATTINIPGHGRLRRAGPVSPRFRVSAEARAEHRQGRAERALPR